MSGRNDPLQDLLAAAQNVIHEPQLRELPLRRRRVAENKIRSAVDGLVHLLEELDPVAQPSAVFDPSNPKIVGRFVSLAMVAQDRHPLASIPQFYGSGVYAIYYNGPFQPYAPLSGTETPIYVGKAAPAVSNARSAVEQGVKLCGRLADHRKNIAKATSTLSLSDFEFRSLVVQSGWEVAAEDYLIHLFRPIWNSEVDILYGLGKHGDAATTRANRRSPWDTMHPGRSWAAGSTEDARSLARINSDLVNHFSSVPPFQIMEDLLASFIEELKQV